MSRSLVDLHNLTSDHALALVSSYCWHTLILTPIIHLVHFKFRWLWPHCSMCGVMLPYTYANLLMFFALTPCRTMHWPGCHVVVLTHAFPQVLDMLWNLYIHKLGHSATCTTRSWVYIMPSSTHNMYRDFLHSHFPRCLVTIETHSCPRLPYV